jgi:hypothetical protein
MARRFKTSKAKRVAQKKYRKARKQYNDYLDQFEARKENFESRGLDFFDPVPLTFRDYRTVHAEKLNDLKQDIKEGKRKTVGNVNREIVSDQAYELSSRQADVLGEYLLENEPELLEEMDLVYKYTDESGVERLNLKKKIDLFMKIRQGEFLREDVGIWDMISDFRLEMFKKGMNKEEVRRAVGQTFFNSPE